MTNTIQLFELAQLAEAAYASFTNFSESTPASTIKTALIAKGFSDTQANEFAANWKVVSHQPDTASDYSGTLFKYIGNDPSSGFTNGELVFSQRGTAGILGDILDADIHGIAINGLAFKQIVDMYNYWQRLTANAGATVHEARLVAANLATPSDKLIIEVSPILGFPNQLSNNYYTIEFVDVTNAGIGVSNIGNLTDITGHSLGGHLAVAFTRLFGGTAAATTINGAGYATGLLPGLGLAADSNIANLFSMLGGAASFTASAATNIFGDKNPNIVTQNGPGLFQTGGHNSLFIEQNSFVDNTFGHGSSQMTDSLAVANLFIKLDASFTNKTPAQALSTLSALMEKGSNQVAQSLEKLVEGLSEIILGYKPTIAVDNRNDLYTVINNLNDATTFLSLIGKVTLVAPPTSASEARDDFGSFLSLYYLTPFALKTDGSAAAIAALGAAQPDLEDKWQADNALTPEQLANGEANFSDQYLADRAAMLKWVLKSNLDDTYGRADGLDAIYVDLESGIHLSPIIVSNTPKFIFGANDAETIAGSNKADHLYGGGGADNINAGDGKDYLEGGADDDTLNGGKGNDRLEGGADNDTLNGEDGTDQLYGGLGDDTLEGGDGIDYLYGGKGDDKYIHKDGDGNDVITDSDGDGSIKSNGTALTGGDKVKGAEYTWESADHKTLYTKFDQGDGKFTLNITLENKEKIFVKDWVNEQLGIKLQDSTPPDVAILTDQSDMYFAKDADEKIDGGEGNDVLVATKREKFTLKGGAGNDLILGYGNSYARVLHYAPDPGNVASVGLGPNSETDHSSSKWQTVNGQWQVDTRYGGRSGPSIGAGGLQQAANDNFYKRSA